MRSSIIIYKLDNGFKAVITDYMTVDAIAKGIKIFNRAFHSIPAGNYAHVYVNVTKTKRRTVKSIRVLTPSEMTQYRSTHPYRQTVFVPPNPAPVVSAVAATPTPVAPTVWVNVSKIAVSNTTEAQEPEKEKEKKPMSSKKPTLPKKSAFDGYYINTEARSIFTTAAHMSANAPDRAVKIMMVGPSGYGKTTLPSLLAEATQKRFLRMNCATIRDPEEWFGYREAKEGSTLFIRSQFADEIEKGDLVLVLDEFNRLEPWLHNTLFPLLDDDGATVVHDELFTIGRGVLVIATINTGYKYTGTFELDEALFNRFDFTLEVGPMPHRDEVDVLTKRTGVPSDKADELVKMASVLRDNQIICSTRTTLLISRMIVSGMSMREAFETAIVRRIPTDVGGSGLRKQAIDLVNVRLGVYVPMLPDKDIFSGSVQTEVQTTLAEVAPAPEASSHEITLYADAQLGKLLPIPVIKALRQLPTTIPLGLREAKDVADRLIKGDTVTLCLNEMPVATTGGLFKSLGVNGKLTTKKAVNA